jgi:hypothetical protein
MYAKLTRIERQMFEMCDLRAAWDAHLTRPLDAGMNSQFSSVQMLRQILS